MNDGLEAGCFSPDPVCPRLNKWDVEAAPAVGSAVVGLLWACHGDDCIWDDVPFGVGDLSSEGAAIFLGVERDAQQKRYAGEKEQWKETGDSKTGQKPVFWYRYHILA